MKKSQRKLRADKSGQLMIVAALAIAFLVSATAIYVYEVSNETSNAYPSSTSNFVLAIKQSTRNTMISLLANISNGGEKTLLTTNLDKLSQVLRSLTSYGISHLACAPFSDSNYDSGVWLSWNTSDIGISSAYTDFTLKIYGNKGNITLNYAVNITTAIAISGYYTELVGDEKLVNLTCNVYNEGQPALANNLTLFYQGLGSWIQVDSSNNLSITGYGNGTYRMSFTADVPSADVQVLTRVYDLRGILVQTNTTCYEA